MGFRNINAFNLAMLAKLAWRLLHGTHSLFYRVYKAWYFPTGSLMNVELGDNPSYVWQSLPQARNLIRDGSVWQIGDGMTVGVDSHKWLLRPPSFWPGADRFMKVSALFDADYRQWDRAKIPAMFYNSTRDDILKINLGNTNRRDKLCWNENKWRTFSVKTAYQVALRLSKPPSDEHSMASQDKRMWNNVWTLNTPPKVQIFIWRAYSDILPTWANLLWCKVQIDPTCTFCGHSDETKSHILWECSLARNVWALAQGKLQKSCSVMPSFCFLTHSMIERLSAKELESWAMIAWSLWNARNRFHFEQCQTQPNAIFKAATSLLEEYQRLALARQTHWLSVAFRYSCFSFFYFVFDV